MDRTLMSSLIMDIENLGEHRTSALLKLWYILMQKTCMHCNRYGVALCDNHAARAKAMDSKLAVYPVEGPQSEEETYLAADEFIRALIKASEWMVYGDPSTERIVLNVRTPPEVKWTELRSPNASNMSASEWMTFTQQVEEIVDMKRQDRLHDTPETSRGG